MTSQEDKTSLITASVVSTMGEYRLNMYIIFMRLRREGHMYVIYDIDLVKSSSGMRVYLPASSSIIVKISTHYVYR